MEPLPASALGLFFELALIRWIPNTVHVVAFFANLVLIGSFLGLGIGMSQPREAEKAGRDAAIRFAILVAALSLVGLFEPRAVLGSGLDYALNEGQGRGIAVPLALTLLFCFVLVVWASIPFGRLVAAIQRNRATPGVFHQYRRKPHWRRRVFSSGLDRGTAAGLVRRCPAWADGIANGPFSHPASCTGGMYGTHQTVLGLSDARRGRNSLVAVLPDKGDEFRSGAG